MLAHHVAPAPAPAFSKKRILVVDDAESTRKGLAWLLAREYEVTTASDGIEGLELASANDFDLVIADVWMPRLDGVRMVQRMRADDRLREVPIIFLTGQASAANVIATISAGARSCLEKPVDPQILEDKIRRVLAHAVGRP
jgi:DNA-binding response OmpR family regulator